MSIEIKVVKTRSDLRKFIYLPAKIHKNHTNWVPPIYIDDFSFFNPKKNKSFEHCDTILLIAYKDKVIVGRIMGIIHKKYNEINNENNARFSFIETYEDQEVFNSLIEYIENWAKQKGCTRLVGPFGFSDKDPEGFMIEGFDKPIVIASNANLPFMNDFIEAKNYVKDVDMVVYKVPIPKEMPALYKSVSERAIRNGKDLVIHEFKTRKELKPWIRPILHLLNETFVGLYGFVPFEEHEMNDYANRYIYLLDPDFIKVVADNQEKPVAFIIGMPDISEGIKKTKGRMLPFGLFRVLAIQKKSRRLSLLLAGIKQDYRSRGLDAIMGYFMFQSAMKRNFEYIDSHLELELNTKVRKEMEMMNGEVYKRYRVYKKDL